MGNWMGNNMGMQLDQANLNNLMGTLLNNLERNIMERGIGNMSGNFRDNRRPMDRDRRDRGPLRGVDRHRDNRFNKFNSNRPGGTRKPFARRDDKDKRSDVKRKDDKEKKEKKEGEGEEGKEGEEKKEVEEGTESTSKPKDG